MHRFAHKAMATVFELFIVHPDNQYARSAAWEAFRLVDRLEQDISRFIPNSDISRINSLASGDSTRISPDTFECLVQCSQLYAATSGAFDISVGHYIQAWLTPDKMLRQPTADELAFARNHTGLQHIELDENQFLVRVIEGPMFLDLGGFGKGYAVDKMAELLKDWELANFFIHSGSSSVLAVGNQPGENGWRISIHSPFDDQPLVEQRILLNEAMSSSGLEKGHHIIDPRTGRPLERERAVWTCAPSAGIADGLSTAFMIMTHNEIHSLCCDNPAIKAMILTHTETATEQHFYGNWK